MKNAARPFYKSAAVAPDTKPAFALRPIAYCVMLACCDAAVANPHGAQVITGNVQMQGVGTNNLQITNNSAKAVINWQGFSIGAGQVTQFNQLSSSSAVLNRVVGADISQINGQLLSNGRVFLINPAGIVIGAGAVIDTAGFVGSTLNMLDADFLKGKLSFSGDANSGSIVNHGYIKTTAGGSVVLVAPNIENSGIIQTDDGKILLAAGRKLTIGSLDANDVQFEVQAPTDSVLNVGQLLANGGTVGAFAGTLKHSGDIRATAFDRDASGRIVLKAQGDVTLTAESSTDATGARGGAVTVQSQAGTARVAGRIDARGISDKGGEVHVLGNRVALVEQASIDVSGATGGGTVLIGGDYQGRNPEIPNAVRALVGPTATIKADAGATGDGGKVIVWADGDTRFDGTISASGGLLQGNGGFVETSGKSALTVGDVHIDLLAPAGSKGTWLLDPKNIVVANGGGASLAAVDQFSDTPANTVTISPGTIAGAGANVVLQANNDITFSNAIVVPTTRSLTAQAGRSIFVNADISGADSAGITLIANEIVANGVVAAQRDPGAASIVMSPGTTITQSGGGGVTLRINPGVAADPTRTSGDIVVSNINVTNGSVNILHNGADAGGRILRSDTASLITASGSVFMGIESSAGATASIGTSAAPMRISTPIVEAHTHNATGGIFIASPNAGNLQIGGAAGNPDTVRGVQTLAGGPIEITVNGTLTQPATAGVCGVGGAAGSGPVCAGPAAGAASALGATSTVALRAADLTLQTVVRGREVSLLPTAGAAILLNAVGGAAPAFRISQAEVNLVDTALLRIGDDSSGGIGFTSAAALSVSKPLVLTSGGNIVGDGTAAGNDLSVTGALTLKANAIGTTGDDLFITPTSTVSATATGGDIFIRHIDPAGMRLSNYSIALPAGRTVRLTNSGAGTTRPFVDASLNVPGANVILSGFGTTTEIQFENSPTVNAASLTLNGNTTFATGAGTATVNATTTVNGTTTFTSGTANLNQTATFNDTVTFNGGTANLNQAATFNDVTTLNGGTANLNAASTVATGAGNRLILSSGTLGGSGSLSVAGNVASNGTGASVTLANGLETTAGGTLSVTAGNHTLTSHIATGAFSLTGGTYNIASTGTMTVTGAGSTVENATLNNAGRFNYNSTTNYTVQNNGTFNNQVGGTLDLQQDVLVTRVSGTGTLTNAGTILKSGGTSVGGLDNTLTFVNNGGTLSATSGVLDLNGGGTYTGVLTGTVAGGAAVRLNGGTHTFTNGSSIAGSGISVFSGTFAVPAGATSTVTGTLNWLGAGAVQGPGTLAISPGGVLNVASGGFASARQFSNVTINNSGSVVYNLATNDLQFDNGTVFNNLAGGTFDIRVNRFLGTTAGAGTFINAAGATLLKSAGGGAGGFGTTLALASDGTLTSNSGTFEYRAAGNFFGAGATFNGTASHVVAGNSTFNGGNTIAGSSPFSTSTGTIQTLNGTVTLQDNVWNNAGTINMGGTSSIVLGGSGATATTLNNNVGGTIADTSTAAAPITFGTTATNKSFVNSGTFNKNAGSAATQSIGVAFTNSNVVNVNTGTLRLTTDGTDSGNYAVGAGGVLDFNAGTRTVTGTISGTGGITVSGAALTSAGAVTATGPLTVTAGAATFNANPAALGPSAVNISGGTAIFNRTLTIGAGGFALSSNGTAEFNSAATAAGPSTISGGTLRGTGGLTINNSLALTGGTITGTGLTVNGTTTVSGGSAQLTTTLDTDAFSMTSGGLSVLAGGALVISDATTPSTATAGTLTNATGGEIRLTGGSTLTFSNNGTLANSGTLNAQNGAFVYGGVQNFNAGTTFSGAAGSQRVTTSSAFTGAITSNNLTLEAGTFTGTATIAGPVAWTGGTIGGAYVTTGALTVSGTPQLTGTLNPAIFNMTGGTLNIANTGFLNLTQAGAKTIDGTTTVVNNAGVVTLRSGNSLALTNGAAFDNAGGTFNFDNASNGFGITGNGTFSNNGLLTSNVAGVTASIAPTLNMTNGTIAGVGGVTANGAFNFAGGTLSGAGTLTTNGLTTISGGATKTITAKTWDNFGTVNSGGTGNMTLTDAAATINNRNGATWNILNGGGNVNDMNGAGTFNNLAGATINAGATSNSIHPATVNHAGTINLQQGDLDFDNFSTVSFSGTINFANGTRLKSYLGAGTTLNFDGATLNVAPGATATLTMDNFAMNVRSALTLPSGLTLNQSTSTLTASAPITFANGAAYVLAGGTLAGASPVTVNGQLTLSGTGVIANAGGVTVAGTTSITGGASRISSSLTSDAYSHAGGTLDIDAGGTLNLNGTASKTISGGSLLRNAGTLNLNGGTLAISTAAGSTPLVNSAGGTSTSAPPPATSTSRAPSYSRTPARSTRTAIIR